MRDARRILALALAGALVVAALAATLAVAPAYLRERAAGGFPRRLTADGVVRGFREQGLETTRSRAPAATKTSWDAYGARRIVVFDVGAVSEAVAILEFADIDRLDRARELLDGDPRMAWRYVQHDIILVVNPAARDAYGRYSTALARLR